MKDECSCNMNECVFVCMYVCIRRIFIITVKAKAVTIVTVHRKVVMSYYSRQALLHNLVQTVE